MAIVRRLFAKGRLLAGHTVMHTVQCVLDDLIDARTGPVLGIDVQADIGIAQFLRHQRRHQFVVGGWFGVTEIRRTQQPHRPAGIGLDHALG